MTLGARAGCVEAAVVELLMMFSSLMACDNMRSSPGSFRPGFCTLALEFQIEDFKDSARRLLGFADARLLVQPTSARPRWENVAVERTRARGFIRALRERLGLPITREAVA